MHPTLKFFLEILPLGAFFAGYQLDGLMMATMLIVIATMVALLISYIIERKIALSPLISGILVAVFGGMTLALNDPLFIKIKPTIVNLLFSLILFTGLYFGKPLLRYLLEAAFKLTDEGWKKLSKNWAFYFIGLALLNEIIWRNFSEEFWVNFKVFGMLPLTIAFTLTQIPLIKKYMLEEVGQEND